MPRSFRRLWPQFVSFENLWAAYQARRRQKRETIGLPTYASERDDALA